MRRWFWLAACAAFQAGVADSADEKSLEKLAAPAPAQISAPFAGKKAQSIKLSRLVVQLKPEPWALVLIGAHGDNEGVIVPPERRLVSWSEGQQNLKPSTLSPILDEEIRRAGSQDDAQTESVFVSGSKSNLQLGARITNMEGRLCQFCGWGSRRGNWSGAIAMSVRWEIYSSIDRKVLATVDTSGGWNQGKPGLEGSPERLINEAFRDNVRRLIGTSEFQKALLAQDSPMPGPVVANPDGPTISLLTSSFSAPSLRQAVTSVATVFSNDGSGSGFLISDDGYVLTNRHVVGLAKYVKLKWPDGRESLGEVIRSDVRRDVALVKTEASGHRPLALQLVRPQVTDTVYAVGSPFGEALQNSVSKGIVSALRSSNGLDYIQSDAVVNHGNSGGPLLDDKARVIGLTVSGRMINDAPIGINFFIPIDDALRTLNLTPPPPAPPVEPAVTASKRQPKP